MMPRPPRSTRTATRFPDTSLFRSRPGAKARGAAPRGNELQPSGDCRRRASHLSRIAGATGMRHRWLAGDRPASQDQVKSGATHPMNSILKMAGLGLALLTAACNQDAATNNADAAANKLAPAQGKDWTKVVVATTEGGVRMGNPDAPVKLIEFASFTCPHCREFNEAAADVLKSKYVASG